MVQLWTTSFIFGFLPKKCFLSVFYNILREALVKIIILKESEWRKKLLQYSLLSVHEFSKVVFWRWNFRPVLSFNLLFFHFVKKKQNKFFWTEQISKTVCKLKKSVLLCQKRKIKAKNKSKTATNTIFFSGRKFIQNVVQSFTT